MPVNSMTMRPNDSEKLCTRNTDDQPQKHWLLAEASSCLFTEASSLSQHLIGSISADTTFSHEVSFFILLSLLVGFFCLFVWLVGWFCFFFLKKEMLKTKTLETTYTRISLLLLHHTTSIIMAHVNMTGTKIRVMRISFGGSSQWTLSKVQFEKNCLWIPVIKLSARGFGQKQLALLASRSVHWVKLL